MRHLSLLVFILASFHLVAQVSPSKNLQNYKANAHPEKIYVHTDKDVYALGENLYMAIYLVDGITHTPGTLSEVVYSELRDKEDNLILQNKSHAPDGHAAADFILPKDLKAGQYFITAYTNNQLNGSSKYLFKKGITLVDGLEPTSPSNVSAFTEQSAAPKMSNDPTDVHFYPEGGDCIIGVTCQVAIEAPSFKSREGIITDNVGSKVASVSFNDDGIARAIYLPIEGKTYYLKMDNEPDIALTKALLGGFHLSVNKHNENLRVLVSSSRDRSIDGSKIVVHVRGGLIIDQTLNSSESIGLINIPFDALPPGINTVTLFNKDDEPMAERLFFVPLKEGEGDIVVDVNDSKQSKRNEVDVSFSTYPPQDLIDSLDNTRLSVSVLKSQYWVNSSENDIRTWLLLNSDLEDHIAVNPDLLFSKDSENLLKKIDNFLLTKAWRKFEWKSEIMSNAIEPIHKIENGIYVQGHITHPDNSKRRKKRIVSMMNLEGGTFEEVATDENGNFSFGPFWSNDNIDVMLEARYSRENKDYNKMSFGDVVIEDRFIPDFNLTQSHSKISMASLENYKKLSDDYLSVLGQYDNSSILLDEVLFTATKKNKIDEERKKRAARNGILNPTRRLIMDDALGQRVEESVFDILRSVPGVNVLGSRGFENIRIRGSVSATGPVSPLIVIDGMPVDIQALRATFPANIDFIDIVTGAGAAIFGIRGAGGAILIYTKNGGNQSVPERHALKDLTIKGFDKARVFATYNYDDISNKDRPDIRTTLYWNPDIRTDKNGQAIDTFTTSDQDGSYIIIAQGIASDGTPLFGTKEFKVMDSN